jgi:hypothetical protein
METALTNLFTHNDDTIDLETGEIIE